MVQILEMKTDAGRWTLYAHGARYSLIEAERVVAMIRKNGHRAMIVEIPID